MQLKFSKKEKENEELKCNTAGQAVLF